MRVVYRIGIGDGFLLAPVVGHCKATYSIGYFNVFAGKVKHLYLVSRVVHIAQWVISHYTYGRYRVNDKLYRTDSITLCAGLLEPYI